MKNTSILAKLFFVFLIIFLLATGSFVHLLMKSSEKHLIFQGRSIAEMVVLFRRWAADYGGIWSKDKYVQQVGFLSAQECTGSTKTFTNEIISKNEKGTFFLHNPALATRELSNYANEKHGYIFRVVSERYMAPEGKPDDFEIKAIHAIKQNASLKEEYWGWDRQYFRYVRALYIEEGCLKCHGDESKIAEGTKKTLISKYGDKVSWGYTVGDLRGIISVKILPENIFKQAVGYVDWINIAALLTAFAVFFIFAKYGIVRPVERLTKAAHEISLGKLDIDLGVSKLNEATVRDEITKLRFAVDRLKTSIKLAMQMIKKPQS